MTMTISVKSMRNKAALLCAGFLAPLYLQAQTAATSQAGSMPLTDLSAFKNPGKTWQIVGDVSADLGKDNNLSTSKGTGVLVNLPDKKNHGEDLYTTTEHGDAELEVDYMIAKGSNSGIYLQGRYELQLLDSWNVKNPKAGDNGGIYERWDESKPEGQKGYEGYPPRQNASRAPGLWQHLKVSFQAPKFDGSGKKTQNARMLRVELNGVVIHENLELLGPTRGAMGNDEKATGPLRFQGDHGAVAFRNLKLISFDKAKPEITNIKYQVYKGKFDKEPDFSKLTADAEGSATGLNAGVSKLQNEFIVRYTGTMRIKEPGEYAFGINALGGGGILKVNNQAAVSPDKDRGSVTLPAGDLPFELLYAKMQARNNPAIGLTVSGPGIREFVIGDAEAASNNNRNPVDPILVEAPTNTILRSFMDLPGQPRTRVVHAVSVGSPQKVHYTYDLDKGAVIQVWRGNFLDATPMWHDRGDGSSRPAGAVQRFGQPMFALAKLGSAQAAWIADSAGTSYRPKGYILDENDQPTFTYRMYGATVSDAIRVMDNGQGIHRELTVQNPAGGDLYARLAEGATIEEKSNGTYLIDGKSYYLRLDDAKGTKPVVRDANGRKELVVPVKGKVGYSILF